MSQIIEFAKQEPFAAFLMVCVICGTLVTLVRGRAKSGENDD